ncbi:hypothetical protein L3X38_040959 [Prunus dulcis]|uniref:40S ribosomal protein S7 n=1 Tax=Prunus dulcis TaxID=3755 RepID=A0AAD4UTI1_PRUDU|nr:hypothetical protein L3X38_040959 [Prunus dulcis]
MSCEKGGFPKISIRDKGCSFIVWFTETQIKMVGSGSAGGDLRTPQFNGSNYDFGSVKMETILICLLVSANTTQYLVTDPQRRKEVQLHLSSPETSLAMSEFAPLLVPTNSKQGSYFVSADKDAELEESVGQAIFDLETNFYINLAVQVYVAGNRKAVVIHIPHRLRKAYRKIHVRLVRELEKKFSGKVII